MVGKKFEILSFDCQPVGVACGLAAGGRCEGGSGGGSDEAMLNVAEICRETDVFTSSLGTTTTGEVWDTERERER